MFSCNSYVKEFTTDELSLAQGTMLETITSKHKTGITQETST